MLQNNGFHKDHIKTFFASSGHLPGKAVTKLNNCCFPSERGEHTANTPTFFSTEDIEGVYSATEKVVIRNHVSYVCRKQHCADTLVLYLNSPTRNDGTMLLWDGNLNGIVRHTGTQAMFRQEPLKMGAAKNSLSFASSCLHEQPRMLYYVCQAGSVMTYHRSRPEQRQTQHACA